MKKLLTFVILISMFAVLGSITGCTTTTVVERPVLLIIPPTPALPVDNLTIESSNKDVAEAYAQSIGICRAYFGAIDEAVERSGFENEPK